MVAQARDALELRSQSIGTDCHLEVLVQASWADRKFRRRTVLNADGPAKFARRIEKVLPAFYVPACIWRPPIKDGSGSWENGALTVDGRLWHAYGGGEGPSRNIFQTGPSAAKALAACTEGELRRIIARLQT